MSERLQRYQEACRKGTEWLLEFANEDGSYGPVRDGLYYYRLPWTFALMGQQARASRLVDWIQKHMFSAEGAFEGLSPQGIFSKRYGSYPLACLLVGAVMVERFDLVYRGIQHLLTWQDPESGGFYNNRTDSVAECEQELFPTAQAGMTLLLVGQLSCARSAGEWLSRLWELQPDIDRRLFHVYNASRGLIIEYDMAAAELYVTRKDQPWQHHFNGGIAAAFLTKLHMATGEERWLQLARHYQNFSMSTDECQFQSMQTCKSGWGSGLLYVAGRGEYYREWTIRMAEWFLANQFSDGHWENTRYWTPNPTVADNIEITTEFVMHLTNVVSYLSVDPE